MLVTELNGKTETAKRILVVEDDTDLCMLIRSILSEMNEKVHVQFASTVHEAAMWLDGEQTFDVVLADFLLADSRNGYELHKVCAERSPDSKFVMMSAMPLAVPYLDECDFLQKPFTAPECEAFIGSTLARA